MDEKAALRFVAKFRDDPATKCWNWTASCTHGGYGQFSHLGLPRRAHRLAYEHWVGPIPPGLELDHLCCNKSCVNPAHLEAVTHTENLRRSPITPARLNAAKTHCKWGHAFSAENTMRRRNPRGLPVRQCRRCAVDASRARYLAKMASA